MKTIISFGIAVLVMLLAPQGGFAKGTPSTGNGANQASTSTPAPTASSGSSSNAAFESQMLAYGALNKIASAIARHVCEEIPPLGSSNRPPAIVIYDQISFASVLSYEALADNAVTIIGAYDTLAGKKPKLHESAQRFVTMSAGGSGAAPSLMPGFADLTSLLSTIAVSANTVNANSITIPDSAMALALTRELLDSTKNTGCGGLIIAYPPIFGRGSSGDTSAGDLQALIAEVNKSRIDAHKIAPTDPSLKEIDTLYDNFINSLVQPNAVTGLLGSATAIQGYQLARLLSGERSTDDATKYAVNPAFVLIASVVSAGGTTRDHKTFWTNLTSGDIFTYSGGVIVEAALWSTNGQRPYYADVLRYRSPLTNVNDPADRTDIDAGASLGKP